MSNMDIDTTMFRNLEVFISMAVKNTSLKQQLSGTGERKHF